MTRETVVAGIYALSIAAIGLADAAWAGNQSICLQSLSATAKPIFSGLSEVKVDANDGSSTEGGECRLYFSSRGTLVYVVATQYGETAKRVASIKLLNGSAHSYSATVASYRYVEPVHAGAVKVADVETSSFIVCDDAVVKGVGSEGVSQDKRDEAKSILYKGVEEFNAIKRNKGASP